MGKRLFLLDHCCVHRYFGHHAPSLELFEDYFGPFFDEIVKLVPHSFNEEPDHFFPKLMCPYPRIAFLHVKKGTTQRKSAARRLRNSIAKRGARLFGNAGVALRMAKNVARIDREYNFNADDLLFFPSAEPHGVRAFCTYFSRRPPHKRPRLHFRMIGVHDAEAVADEDPIASVARHIKLAKKSGVDAQISGETPKYLELLQQALPDAFLVPYPFNEWREPKTKEPNAIGCLGQGRLDKGYFRIAGIVEKVAQTHPQAKWIIHSMRSTDPRYSPQYQEQLERHDNVRIEAGVLSNDELNALYDEASFSLLPYHEETYRIRGSAVLQEALARGQLCIAPAGTGISSALEFFGNGLVARTDDEFAAAVGALLDMPEEERKDRVKQAQARYDDALSRSIPKILRNDAHSAEQTATHSQ